MERNVCLEEESTSEVIERVSACTGWYGIEKHINQPLERTGRAGSYKTAFDPLFLKLQGRTPSML